MNFLIMTVIRVFFVCFFNKISGQILHHIYQNRKVLQTHSLLYRFYINRHELSTASSLPLGAQQYLMSEIPRGSPLLDRTLVFAAGEGVYGGGGDSSLAAQLASPAHPSNRVPTTSFYGRRTHTRCSSARHDSLCWKVNLAVFSASSCRAVRATNVDRLTSSAASQRLRTYELPVMSLCLHY